MKGSVQEANLSRDALKEKHESFLVFPPLFLEKLYLCFLALNKGIKKKGKEEKKKACVGVVTGETIIYI